MERFDCLSKSDILVIARALRSQLSDWTDIVREVNADIRENGVRQWMSITPGMIRTMFDESRYTISGIIVAATDKGMDSLVPDLVKFESALEEVLAEHSKLLA